MALEPGKRFGSYEIAAAIGSGGMGEVYRAMDTELKRDVALKVLPPAFVEDSDRLARFQREAEILASLNHPNIAQVYGLEKVDGQTAIVMELVEGPTLADRIQAGPIAPDEAVGIALQIASALEAAHDQQIVHRDLKPANVKVRQDGTVKVLDFGISRPINARAISGGTPVMTTPAVTETGMILGTAAYMSPEQARGRFVDQRTDIWAFGCLLFEMLTGQPAFAGEDVTITLARVIERDMNFDALPSAVSFPVRHTIRLCLQKDVRKRLHHIGDVRLGLEGLLEPEARPDATATLAKPASQRFISLALTAVAGVLIASIVAAALWPRPVSVRVSRFDQILPEGAVVRRNGRSTITIAPDGSAFVYNTAIGLLLRRIEDVEPHVIPGTEPDLVNPFFSPDGAEVAYWDPAGELYRVAIDGATPPVMIAEGIGNPYGASWSDDGSILLGQDRGIVRIPARGGEPELMIEAGDDELVYGPTQLPGGEWVLFGISPINDPEDGRVVIASLATGERRDLGENGNDARYVPTGHLVYARDDVLLATPFDIESLTVTGSARPLVPNVKRANAGQSAVAQYDIADDGTLVYLTGEATTTDSTIVWVDRDGREEMLAVPGGAYSFLRISPDGTRVVLDDGIGDNGFWVWNFGAEILTTLTLGEVATAFPIWSRDGTSIVYSAGSGSRSIQSKAANNTGSTVELASGPGITLRTPNFFTPAGDQLVFTSSGGDIGIVPIGTGGELDWLMNGPGSESNGELSPDGRWLAYQSDESGRMEVYVRPFPDVDRDRVQVSNDGGLMPLWSPDGSELFYLDDSSVGANDSLTAVTVTATDDAFSFTDRRVLLERWLYVGTFAYPERAYDVSADGQRFLAIRNAAIAEDTANIIIVQNWFEELERLVPGG
ncbi:MAG: protein kinase [Gammaproteobacteria bacterium]